MHHQSSIASLVLASSAVDEGARGLRWTLAREMFLVLIDAHSKWMEVEPVESATTKTTVEKLRKIFSTYGISEKLVSDNGSVFTSQEFTDFVKSNGIEHIKTAPYHPPNSYQAYCVHGTHCSSYSFCILLVYKNSLCRITRDGFRMDTGRMFPSTTLPHGNFEFFCCQTC